MQTFKVIIWNEREDHHVCQDEQGRKHNIDLRVAGNLPEEVSKDPESLVGKTVEIEWMHPYVSIANGVVVASGQPA